VTRRRTACRCCGQPADSTYCARCGTENTRHATTVRAAILATFGTDGLTRYQTTLRAQRLAAKRATTRRTA
jgi:predicted amidophosphoribosyltransferase